MAVNILEPLIGLVFNSVESKDNQELIFLGDKSYAFYHEQYCCEDVEIVDVVGDLSDLIGSPIIKAEERVYDACVNPQGVPVPEYQDCFEWTFYEFATIKGSVTVRWHGNSNGYYSTSVSYKELNHPAE